MRPRAMDRKVRKFAKAKSRFSGQLVYAPRRVRLGQVFRLLRTLVVADKVRVQGFRFIGQGGLSL